MSISRSWYVHLGANMSISWSNMYILGANMYILNVNMSISGANMSILGPNMYILGANMSISWANMYQNAAFGYKSVTFEKVQSQWQLLYLFFWECIVLIKLMDHQNIEYLQLVTGNVGVSESWKILVTGNSNVILIGNSVWNKHLCHLKRSHNAWHDLPCNK